MPSKKFAPKTEQTGPLKSGTCVKESPLGTPFRVVTSFGFRPSLQDSSSRSNLGMDDSMSNSIENRHVRF